MAASTIVEVVLNAKDNLSATLNSVGSGFQTLGRKAASGVTGLADDLKKFQGASLAASGALAGLGVLVKSSIDDYKQEQEVVTKLTTLILNQKGATMEQVSALKNQARAMQDVTTYGDELVLTAQAQLATFDLSTDSIMKIIPGFLDMVAAEKGATISMEEMKAAAQGMGKALVGQTDTLVKQGFIFTDLQKDILKTGTEQERLTVITEVMGRTYGGMAAKLLENQGAAGQLQKQFSELKETLATQLKPALDNLIAGLVPLVEKVTAWIQKNPELAKQIAIITVGVLGFIAVLGPLGFAIAGIIALIGAIATPIGIVVAALIALGVIWVLKKDLMIAGLQELKEQFNAAKNAIMNNFINPLKAGIEAVRDAFSRVADLVRGGIPGRATGGAVQSGSPYIVGERGPELFVPHQSGTIMPNASGAGGSGGSVTLNVSIGMYAGSAIEKRNIAEELYNALIFKARSQNKNVAELLGA